MPPKPTQVIDVEQKPQEHVSFDASLNKLSRKGYKRRSNEKDEKITGSLNSNFEEQSILKYEPERDFEFKISSQNVLQIYNFSTKKFFPRLWGPIVREEMRHVVKSCDFGADRGISYIGRSTKLQVYFNKNWNTSVN